MIEKIQAEKIFEVIKKDDEEGFVTFVVQKNLQNLCFGRFPLLSVCYLFDSKKIISKYEKTLGKINKFEICYEPFEIYKRFKVLAKKSMRLYLNKNSICYPIEMLAVLDRRNKIAKDYKFLFKNEEILTNLTKIYKLNSKIEINATSENFVCETKKLSFLQRLSLITASILVALFCVFSCSSILFVAKKYGLGTDSHPIQIKTEEELVKALDGGKLVYQLTSDITLKDDFDLKDFSGTIDGAGKTVTIKNATKALVQNLSGTIKNLVIGVESTPQKITQNYSIIAEKSTGNLQNIRINANIDASVEVLEDTYISVFANYNSGVISDCSVSLNAKLENSNTKNAYVSAFAGVNSGTISNCTAESGAIETDTVDIAICSIENSGTIDGFKNNISAKQTSGEEWNPNCSGVVCTNTSVLKNVVNNAKIEAISTAENKVVSDTSEQSVEVYVAGIALQNAGSITGAKNYGEIVASGKLSTIFAGGIASINTFQEMSSKLVLGEITNSKSVSKITATGENSKCIVGGIVSYNLANIEKCGSESEIVVSSDSYSGGLVGRNGAIYNTYYGMLVYSGLIYDCYTNSTFAPSEAGANKENYTFGSLIGLVDNNYVKLSNNHYVKNDSYNAVLFLGSITNPLTNPANCYANEYNSFDEIPSEVIDYVK